MRARIVYSLGHSTLSIEAFVTLLKRHCIDIVCDVRSHPYSRFSPHFCLDTLQEELKSQGVAYSFLGRELGGRSSDPSVYENGRVSYDRLAQTSSFQRGLDKVRQLSIKHRVALMCAEREPLACHRTILISRHLHDRQTDISHILPTGVLESHETTLARLLKVLGLSASDLYRSPDEIAAEAYEIQGSRISYGTRKGENHGNARDPDLTL